MKKGQISSGLVDIFDDLLVGFILLILGVIIIGISISAFLFTTNILFAILSTILTIPLIVLLQSWIRRYLVLRRQKKMVKTIEIPKNLVETNLSENELREHNPHLLDTLNYSKTGLWTMGIVKGTYFSENCC